MAQAKTPSASEFDFLLYQYNSNTVEPLLSGQLLKSRNYCQYSTVKKLLLKGHCHGHFLAFLLKRHQN